MGLEQYQSQQQQPQTGHGKADIEEFASPFAISKVEGEQRRAVAAFMAAEFEKHFAARIEDDTEEVYAVYDADGEICLAFGLNRSLNRFFSRHYVEDLEHRMHRLYGKPAQGAQRVVEFAHLCVRAPRDLCRLVPLLAEYLARGADAVICTATRELGQYFVRRGLTPDRLGVACLSALPVPMRQGWGTYYQHQPVVLGGSLHDALRRLNPASPQVSKPVMRELRDVA